MAENSISDIQTLAQEGAEAGAPYGAAVGLSTNVANEAFSTEAGVQTSVLNLEVAKQQLEHIGAGTSVVEIAAISLDTIGNNLGKFGKKQAERGVSHKEKAASHRERLKRIQDEKVAKLNSQEEQKILQAQVEQINPNLSVVKNESGNYLERKMAQLVDSWEQNVERKYRELRVVANEGDAEKHSKRSKIWEKAAKVIKRAANNLRDVAVEVPDSNLEQAQAAVASSTEAVRTGSDRASVAAEALDTVRGADYFMPQAGELSGKIEDKGGDPALRMTKEAAREWSGSLPGTNSTT